MADIPKLPKPTPKAVSTVKAPKTLAKPKADAPPRVKPGANKPMGVSKLSSSQLNQEELAQQASQRQQQSKGQSQKKSSTISQRARQLGDKTAKGLDSVSQDGPTNKDEHIAKRAAKQVGKDAGKVASGAIKGALRGGLHGAAIGAAKGVAKSKSFWVVFGSILAFAGIFFGGTLGLLIFGLMGDTDSDQESVARADAGAEVAESAAASYAGNDSVDRMLQRAASTSGADFYVLTSVLAEEGADTGEEGRPEDGWYALDDETVDALVEDTPNVEVKDDLAIEDETRWIADILADQQRETFDAGASMDLAAGYSLAVEPGGRTPIDGQDEVRQQMQDTWIEVLEELPIIEADDKAHSIFDRARNWKLGSEKMLCGPSTQLASSTSDDSDDDGENSEDSGDTVAASDGGASGAPTEYQGYIANAAQVSGLSEQIITAQLKQESNFNPNAVSPAGAMGLAQFMPATWAQYGEGDAFDPEASIDAQGRYMKVLMDIVEPMAGGDQSEQVKLALAAYNAGPGNVQKHGGIPPFAETQNYVEIITGAAGEDLFSVGCSAFASGLTVDGVGTDDYIHRLPLGAPGWGSRSVMGFTPRQCTDFTAWRINQAMGWKPGDGEPPFSFRALGVSYGPGQTGAGSWVDILTQVDGIEFTKQPQPGDIAWWGYGDVGGGFGHVGFVAEVNGDQVTVEHYNYSQPNRYSATTHSSGSIPGYIRIGQLNNSKVES